MRFIKEMGPKRDLKHKRGYSHGNSLAYFDFK